MAPTPSQWHVYVSVIPRGIMRVISYIVTKWLTSQAVGVTKKREGKKWKKNQTIGSGDGGGSCRVCSAIWILIVTSFTEARKRPQSDFTSFANHQKGKKGQQGKKYLLGRKLGLYPFLLQLRDIRI